MSAPRCLVFGGSGAVGGAVLTELVTRGARVAFTYHENSEVARRRAADLDLPPALQVDLADAGSVERGVDAAAEALGGLDAFVQCAGLAVTVDSPERCPAQHLPDIDERAWDRMLDVVVRGTFFASRRVIRVMEGGGNLVLLGAVDGVKSAPAPVHHAAACGALSAMARAMAKEVGARGIRVNVVAPGPLEDGQSTTLSDAIKQDFQRHSGLRRLGKASEVAAVVRWLALENTYLTGRTVCVDGGL